MNYLRLTRKEFLGVVLTASAMLLPSCAFEKSSQGAPKTLQDSSSKGSQATNRVSGDDESSSETQYGFWMDSSRCIGCVTCIAACIEHNETPTSLEPRRRVLRYTLESGEERTLSYSCMHCAEPACERVCPAHAITKRTDGIVVVDKSRCIGCQYCRQTCPFDIPRYADAGMDKCDCCLGAGVKPGREPYCVQACPTDALRYGTMEQLERDSRGCATQLDAPTHPSYYLS